MESSLNGKVGIVTGASRGIGRAIAEALASNGVGLIVAGIDQYYDYKSAESRGRLTESGELEQVANELRKSGARVIAVRADVSKPRDLQMVVDNARDEFGRIDILIQNAGVTIYKLSHELTEDEWDMQLEVNLKAVWMGAKLVIPMMMRQKAGVIINIASQSAKTPYPYTGAYSAAKAGIVSLTKTLCRELGPYGIRVNSVCPGVTMTPQAQAYMKEVSSQRSITADALSAELLAHVPLGRANQPQDIADLVCFLASDRARQITGQSINIGGGDELS